MLVKIPIVKNLYSLFVKDFKMAQQIRPSKLGSKKPRIDWSRREEADNFAQTVKLYRQGKIDHDNFRRFRLQHGAYGTRMTDDYEIGRAHV